LTPSRKHAAILLAALTGLAAAAFSVRARLQGQIAASPPAAASSAWPVNRNLIVLDPAHGGSDSGAVLGDRLLEKDITLAMASRLKAALIANGFTVVATRDADGSDPLPTDQRAETANRAHAVACIVLHATVTGSGVHIYTSPLQPPAPTGFDSPSAFVPVPWESAQTAFVPQSLDLAEGLGSALAKNHLPALVGQAPIRPLDNLMCPAVAIELSPLPAPGVGATPATDANYQQQVANALAVALRAWRDRAMPSAVAAGSQAALKGPQ
jgi:N-acetylmuramoyl-L-alanine amidase